MRSKDSGKKADMFDPKKIYFQIVKTLLYH